MIVPPINSGALRYLVAIQTQGTAQDSFGQTSANPDTWTDVGSVWASIDAMSGKDMYALGSGFTSQVSHKIVIRFDRQFLSSKQQVLYDDRTFSVEAALDPNGMKEQIWLLCLERNNS